jgi:hypothetical protein
VIVIVSGDQGSSVSIKVIEEFGATNGAVAGGGGGGRRLAT